MGSSMPPIYMAVCFMLGAFCRNPWIEKAANTKDFGDEEYKGMVCLEAANAAVHMHGSSIEVPAGGSWTASQTIYTRAIQS